MPSKWCIRVACKNLMKLIKTFDSEGNPIDAEKKSIIQGLTDLGYQFDGLTTGYPNGEVSWITSKICKIMMLFPY